MFRILKSIGVFDEPASQVARQTDHATRPENTEEASRTAIGRRYTRFRTDHAREPVQVKPMERPGPQRSDIAARSKLERDESLAGHLHSSKPISIETLRTALPMRFASINREAAEQGVDD